MFGAPAILCLVTSLISAEQFSREPDKIETDEVRLTIRLEGDNARRYAELVKSPEITASFKETGKILILGVATVIDESRSWIRHTAIVRVVGQPLELLSMESEIQSALIIHVRAASPTQKEEPRELLVQLGDIHPMTIRVKKLVGSFPDSTRYR